MNSPKPENLNQSSLPRLVAEAIIIPSSIWLLQGLYLVFLKTVRPDFETSFWMVVGICMLTLYFVPLPLFLFLASRVISTARRRGTMIGAAVWCWLAVGLLIQIVPVIYFCMCVLFPSATPVAPEVEGPTTGSF